MNWQLRTGAKHELEHTKSMKRAMKIAEDHLREDPKYYTHLLRMEKLVKSGKWNPPKKKISSKRFRQLSKKIYELAIKINKAGQKAYHLNRRAARPKWEKTAKAIQWRKQARALYRQADKYADMIEKLNDMLDEET